MRFGLALLLALASTSVVLAQAPAPVMSSFGELASALKAGDILVVTEESGAVTRGSLVDLSPAALTLALRKSTAKRTFDEHALYSIRQTDPLGNGTGYGAFAGALASAAMLLSCGHGNPEVDDLCMAAGITSFLLTVPVGALVGRAIDRALGNREIYRRTVR